MPIHPTPTRRLEDVKRSACYFFERFLLLTFPLPVFCFRHKSPLDVLVRTRILQLLQLGLCSFQCLKRFS